ncbi:MAG: TonB-dependent receptor [Flavobacterium sp.]
MVVIKSIIHTIKASQTKQYAFLNTKTSAVSLLFLLVSQISLAQKKEQIGNETVNVVKAYTPKISDASKAKENPDLDDEGNEKKERIKYAIFSFPVASTFTPSKGKAEGVTKEKQAQVFQNYATLGVGNYGTLIGELFVNHELNNTDYVGGMFRHHSSQGGINEVVLDDNFYDTALDVMYGSNQKGLSYNLNAGYQNQVYNWYGLPASFGAGNTPQANAQLISGIDPLQAYTTLSLGGNVVVSESFLQDATVKFTHFFDKYDSAENHFAVKPTFVFNTNDTAIKTELTVDYLSGSLKNNFSNTNVEALKYGFTNLGLAPSFEMQRDDWTLNLGAALFYSMESQNSKNSFFIYPKVTASYKVVGDLMLFYAGAQGDLKQNSYESLVGQNPFLSPTNLMRPTDQQFDIYAGLKGKLSNSVSYNVRGSYLNESNKFLFRANNYSENSTNPDYGFGNSFQVVYDDVKTASFYGELKADFSKAVSFGVNGTVSTYKMAFQQEAWNLPTLQVNANLDVTFSPKWFAAAHVYYVGERKDFQENTSIVTNSSPITLDGYFDVNAKIGYKYSDRLTAFLNGNNLANNSYQKWLNLPVQGLQLVVGANYKFDF